MSVGKGEAVKRGQGGVISIMTNSMVSSGWHVPASLSSEYMLHQDNKGHSLAGASHPAQ